ncbi:MAG: ribose-5-phosphate isomerase RpiA [Pseudomonadota bacterium]
MSAVTDLQDQKQRAAAAAMEYVASGMRLGLGTGSTAAAFINALGAEVSSGLDVVCVATSAATEAQARDLGIKLSTLDDLQYLDLAVDGADEIDSELRLIKGGGGALLREKIVAAASDRMVVIADSTKLVDRIGTFPLPIEVVRFGIHATRNMIQSLATEAGCEGQITLRRGADEKPFVTENGNLILDCKFQGIPQPEFLAELFQLVPGVVEHGMFLGLTEVALIAEADGEITKLEVDDDDEDDGAVSV